MGFLFDIAKDLIADSAADIAKKVATEKGKKIALGAGVAAATGIGAAATGALLNKKRKATSPAPAPPVLPQGNMPPAVPLYTSPALPSIPQATGRPAPPVPPKFSFYAMIENVQRGPYNEVQFKRLVDNGLADTDTLVWKDGMDDWTPACEVKMMAKLFPQHQKQTSASAMPQMPQTGYFVNVNNQRVGPFTVAQLQQFAQAGEFTAQMYVWCEGMAQWQVASSVAELEGLFAPQMPTMPQA